MEKPPLGPIPDFILKERALASFKPTLYVYDPTDIDLQGLIEKMYNAGITEFTIRRPRE